MHKRIFSIVMIAPIMASMPRALDQCTVPCVPNTQSNTGQAPLPQGVTFAFEVVPGSSSPGSGTANCQATCVQCAQGVNLIWNNNGTSNCLQFDTGGGWSSPLPRLSRPGNLLANCDGFSIYSIQLVDCTTGVPGYTKSITMYCFCGGS